MDNNSSDKSHKCPPLSLPFYYGWFVISLCFLTTLTSAGVRSSPSVLIHPLEAEFGWSRTLIASAVNRYFGYFLVREVKLSAEPFTARSAAKIDRGPTPPEVAKHADTAVAEVSDPALKDALKSLGEQVLSKRPR